MCFLTVRGFPFTVGDKLSGLKLFFKFFFYVFGMVAGNVEAKEQENKS